MTFTIITAAIGIMSQQFAPALWLTPDGTTLVDGKAVQSRLVAPARLIKLDGIVAWDFNNGRGGLHFDDIPALRLTESMTVSAWLKLRSYVNDGPGAQILFRGDDRNGLDPYTLVVQGDNSIYFGIQNEEALGRSVSAEVPVQRWFHVLANFDSETGGMEMWLDGNLVSFSMTARRPFSKLDPAFTPGVSVGNVQNENGPHNQPLNGLVADLRLYRGVIRPKDLDLGRGSWNEPPKLN